MDLMAIKSGALAGLQYFLQSARDSGLLLGLSVAVLFVAVGWSAIAFVERLFGEEGARPGNRKRSLWDRRVGERRGAERRASEALDNNAEGARGSREETAR